MAGLQLVAANSAAVSIVANTAKMIVGVNAPTNQRLRILGYGVSFDGVTASAIPATVRLRRHTTAGTSTALTIVKAETEIGVTIQSTAGENYTVNPTLGDIVWPGFIHPQGGVFDKVFPLDWKIFTAAGGRIGIVVTTPSGAATVNVQGYILFEE